MPCCQALLKKSHERTVYIGNASKVTLCL